MRNLRETMMWLVAATAFVASTTLASDVVGTGNPTLDVANVQAAVDMGGTVRLLGSFDFTGGETGPAPMRVITVTKAVQILGVPTGSHLPTIRGGESAFFVDAAGMDVTIDRLHFVGQTSAALTIAAGGNVIVSHCEIDSVIPSFLTGQGFVSFGINVPGDPLKVKVINFLDIEDNAIDVAAGPTDNTIGIFVVGPVDFASIELNGVRNATAHAIDLRNIGEKASADIERNDVTVVASSRTGDPAPPADRLIEGIRGLGSGLYTVRQNTIRVEHPNATGIRMQAGTTAMVNSAVVERNKITMALPRAAVPGAQSAAVQVIRGAVDTGICQNTVSGVARTAVSVVGPVPPFVIDNTLISQTEYHGFVATFVDVEVGAGVQDTLIDREVGTISDLGTGTVVVSNASNGQRPSCGD